MAKKDYEELARDIIKNVGGEENVTGLRHCITRLRFNLKDEAKANTDYLKKRDGVVTVVQSSGQYQVVIGNEVGAVYEAITNVSNIGGASSSVEEDNKDINPLDKFIDTLSGLFQPFLGVLAGTGIIKGIVGIMAGLGLDPTSGIYQVLNMVGDGFFQFLPIALAITAAEKFRMNRFTAIAIAGIFLYPSLGALQDGELLYTLFAGTPFASDIYNSFLGFPVILPPAGNYYSSVIPIILAIWFTSKVEKWVKSWMPQILDMFFTPMPTVIIGGTLSLLVVGPIATWAANLIGAVFTGIDSISPILLQVLLAAAWQPLVIFGLHWGIVPLILLQLTTLGYSAMGAAVAMSTFPMFGALLAIIWKTKEQRTKELATGAALPAFFGITEPAIYSVILPMKKPFVAAVISNAIVGIYTGVVSLVSYSSGGLGIFSIPNYIDPAGVNTMNVWHRVISFALAIVLGFVITLMLGIDKIQDEDEEEVTETTATDNSKTVEDEELLESAKQEIIASPLTGEVVTQENIEDQVFASGAMGKAIAINPTDGTVYAPTNATVSLLFPTGHAIGLMTEEGTEILVHIGLDTVELDGEGFEVFIEKDDKVVAGQKLVSFDMDLIKERGFSVQTPIVVTNSNDFEDVLFTNEDKVEQGDYLITSVK